MISRNLHQILLMISTATPNIFARPRAQGLLVFIALLALIAALLTLVTILFRSIEAIFKRSEAFLFYALFLPLSYLFFGWFSWFKEWITAPFFMAASLSLFIVVPVSLVLILIVAIKKSEGRQKIIYPMLLPFSIFFSSLGSLLNQIKFSLLTIIVLSVCLLLLMISKKKINLDVLKGKAAVLHIIFCIAGFIVVLIYVPVNIFPRSPKGLQILYRAPFPDVAHSIYGMAVDPEKRLLYFSDGKDRSIGVVDLTTEQIRLSEKEFPEAEHLILSSDGSRLYTYLKSDPEPQVVVEIEASSLQRIRAWRCGTPANIALDEKRQKLIVPTEIGWALYQVDLQTGNIEKVFIPTLMPMVVHPPINDSYLFYPTIFSCTISSLTPTQTNKNSFVVHSALIGPFAIDASIGQNTKRVYLTKYLLGSVDVIDPNTLKRIARYKVPSMVRPVAIDEKNSLIFSANFFSGEVHAIVMPQGKINKIAKVGPKIRKLVWSSELDTLFLNDRMSVYSIKGDLIRNLCGLDKIQ